MTNRVPCETNVQKSSLPLSSSCTNMVLCLFVVPLPEKGGGEGKWGTDMTDRPWRGLLCLARPPGLSTRHLNRDCDQPRVRPDERAGVQTRSIPERAFQPPFPLSSGCTKTTLHDFAVPLPCEDRHDQSIP